MTCALPDLDCDCGALAPHIAPKIMELHHSKHHATYMTGVDTALEQLAEARKFGSFGGINKLEKNLAFHLGGRINHSAFWKNMSSEGGGRSNGELAAAIDEYFSNFDGFQKQFNAATNGIQGSGWPMLVFDTLGRHLNINQLYDQQNNLPASQIPLLRLDMWEHALYLQYKNVGGDYVDAWWNMVDQPDVAKRFIKAQSFAS